MSLDRNAILGKAPSLPREGMYIPEWGGTIYVRTLSAWERDQLEADWSATKKKNFRARLAVATVCDENGKDLFKIEDIPVLGMHSAAILDRIATVAFRLSRFTDDDVKELEKNSESGPAGDSSSG